VDHPSNTVAVRQALRSIDALTELSDESIDALARIGSLHDDPAGSVLFSEGQHHDKIYFLISGSVTLDMMTAKCGRQIILTVGRGELLAWSPLIDDQLMTATAMATEPTQSVAFVAKELLSLLEAQPLLGFRVMWIVARALSRRLLATRLQLLDLYHR
jgi:CRP/FNR family transcriptional regulator, cyclic AMP receptor protein